MDIGAFNWLDWVVVGLIVLSTLVGLLRGFVREALSLVVWVLAFWLAYTFANDVASLLQSQVQNESIRYGIGFAAVFIVTLIVGGLFNHMIATAVSKTGLGGTDRLLGLVFGGLRGILIIAIVLLLASITPVHKQKWYKEATTIPHFTWLVDYIHGLLPQSVTKHLQPNGSAKHKASGTKTLPAAKKPASTPSPSSDSSSGTSGVSSTPTPATSTTQ